MGFFSWKTADTEESIPSTYAGEDVPNAGRTVYLLQPNGQPPIKETAYEGYGHFGGLDAYDWLARQNSDSSERNVGIDMECGSHYYDPNENSYYVCALHLSAGTLKCLVDTGDAKVIEFDNYNSILHNGKTPNIMKMNGLWETRKLPIKYPLKFSFDPEAVYEDLPASKQCEHQGFFY